MMLFTFIHSPSLVDTTYKSQPGYQKEILGNDKHICSTDARLVKLTFMSQDNWLDFTEMLQTFPRHLKANSFKDTGHY